MRAGTCKKWLLRLFLLAWLVQTAWLGWHFFPEAQDLVRRLYAGKTGAAVRLEDPFYLWLMRLKGVMPPDATYVFLDRYEEGRYIEARYHLYPRRLILASPEIPPTYLFYLLRQDQASYLVVASERRPLGPGVQAALGSSACAPVDLPAPGPVLRVDYARLTGDFYE